MKRIFIRVFVSVCDLMILITVLTCIVLKHGISFNDLTIGRVNVSHSALVWNEKLELQIDIIKIGKGDGTKQATPVLDVTKKAIFASQRFARFFSRLNIDNLLIGGKSLAVNLIQEDVKTYMLTLVGEHTDFRSRLTFYSDALVVDIIDAVNKRYNSKAKGQVRLDAENDNVSGTISALINGSFPVSIDVIADNEQISFEGKEAGQILEITSLVDLFGLSHNIQRWITDYLSGSRYHLKSFKGLM